MAFGLAGKLFQGEMMVHDWKQAWRWLSVQLAALLAVLPIAWAELPPDLKAYIPEEWRPFIVSGMALAVIIGRLRRQGGGDA